MLVTNFNYHIYICSHARLNSYFRKPLQVQTASVSVWTWLQLMGVTGCCYCIGKIENYN